MFEMNDLENLETGIKEEIESFDALWVLTLSEEEKNYAPFWSFIPLMNFTSACLGPMIAYACGKDQCDEEIHEQIEDFEQKNLEALVDFAKNFDLENIVWFDKGSDEGEAVVNLLNELSENFGDWLDLMREKLIPEDLQDSANLSIIWSQLIAFSVSDYAFSNILRLKEVSSFKSEEFQEQLETFRNRVNEEITELSKNSLVTHLNK